MKKALILYSGARTWGGVETYLLNLLNEENDLVEFYLLSMGSWELTEKLSATLGDRVIVLPAKRSNLSLLLFGLSKILKENKIDILISQGVVANFYARFSSILSGITQITVVHSVLKNEYSNSLVRLLYSLSDSLLKWKTKKFIAVSEYIKSVLIEEGVNPNKITVIYNGVKIGKVSQPVILATSRSPESASPKTNDLRSATKKTIIGSVGRLAHEKGYDILIEAAKSLPQNIEIRICGEGSERATLEKLIEKNKLEEKVKLLGFCENTEDFYKSLDLYVQPSRTEGFGFTVIEAMAFGIPVIVSSEGALPELVTKKNGTVLKELTIKEIKEAVEDNMRRLEELKKKAVDGIEEVLNKFDHKVWFENTIKAIEKEAK